MTAPYNKSVLTFLALFAANITIITAKSPYKICVPQQYLESCQKMVEVETKSKAEIECIPARDRVECITLVQQRQADFVPVDPEDMYVSTKIINEDFTIFQEYRTDDEPDAEFRYQAVIVVRNNLPVTNLEGLRGLKSCHTGVDRNVGYKIPLTMLMRRGILPPMNDRTISPKENELKALSQMFTKSCIVGGWSPDPKTNSAWKSKYSSLCALCENPAVCDYPDNFSGYEGALRCLAHNGGDVAFTKVIFVRKFFGLPVGTIPASSSPENPDEYSYLCSDGSKVPVREKACSWAARPWQGLMGHEDILARLSPIRQKVKQLADIGKKSNESWFTDVLGLSSKIHHVADNIPISPIDYLTKANYTPVIERGHGLPEPTVRLCVTSDVAEDKCRTMSTFGFSRDIRPKLDCVEANSQDMCLNMVRDNGADLVSVDGDSVGWASLQYNLHPVYQEVYGEGRDKGPAYAVAVLRKGGLYRDLEGLRGKRSCHNAFGSFEGHIAPIYALVSKGIIKADECPRERYLATFFSGGSCLPAADEPINNPRGDMPVSLTKLCRDKSRDRDNDSDGVQCLKEGRGDVAFVSSLDLKKLDSTQYELLCVNRGSQAGAEGRAALSEYASCHVSVWLRRAWLSATDTVVDADVAVSHAPLALAQLLEKQKYLFNIYGQYLKNNNVIFNNDATGLVTVEKADFEKLKEVHRLTNACN